MYDHPFLLPGVYRWWCVDLYLLPRHLLLSQPCPSASEYVHLPTKYRYLLSMQTVRTCCLVSSGRQMEMVENNSAKIVFGRGDDQGFLAQCIIWLSPYPTIFTLSLSKPLSAGTFHSG